jgi:hypothetical protein
MTSLPAGTPFRSDIPRAIVGCFLALTLVAVACGGGDDPSAAAVGGDRGPAEDAAADAGRGEAGDPRALDAAGEAEASPPLSPAGCRVVPMPRLTPPNVLAIRGAVSTQVTLTASVPSLTGSVALPATLSLRFDVPNGAAATVELPCAQPGTWCGNGRTLEYVYNGGDHYDPYGIEMGSVSVAALADKPLNNEIVATTTTLRFRRTRLANASPIGEEFVPGGDCIELSPAAIAATAPLGATCIRYTDCAIGDACAATTLTCAHSECEKDEDCGASRVCESVGGPAPTPKTCFDTCSPFLGVTGCAPGLLCRRRTLSSTTGLCQATGPNPKPLGQACEPSEVATRCGAGLRCRTVAGSSICAPACDHFAGAPGCAAAERCLPEDICGPPPAQVDASAIDGTCLNEGAPCADDGKRYVGQCTREFQSPNLPPALVCRQVCVPGVTSCGTGQCRAGIPGRSSVCSIF